MVKTCYCCLRKVKINSSTKKRYENALCRFYEYINDKK